MRERLASGRNATDARRTGFEYVKIQNVPHAGRFDEKELLPSLSARG